MCATSVSFAVSSRVNEQLQDDSAKTNVDKVNAIVRQAATQELSEEAQDQLGRLRSIIAVFESKNLKEDYVESLLVAATALTKPKPNILLAQSILWDLEFYCMRERSGLAKILVRLSGGWPMTTVALALALAILAYLIIWGLIYWLDRTKALADFLSAHGHEILTAMFFGLLGGCMSILTRIQRPSDLQKLNPVSLFLNCFFKPIVGAVFALLIYLMLETNILGGLVKTNLPVADSTMDQNWHKYLFLIAVLGFAAGFSERFAADAISNIEGGRSNRST